MTSLSALAQQGELFIDGDWVESKDQDPQGEVRLVQLADIGDGSWLDKSKRFMTMEKAKHLRCTFLQPGDLLIARMPDPIGRACIFPGRDQPCVTVVDVCILRTRNGIDANWLKHQINGSKFRASIKRFTNGTTRARIARSNLGDLPISVPPLEEQKRIAAILDKADAIRRKREQAIQLADEFLRSLFLDMFGDPVRNPKGWPVGELGKAGSSRLGKMLDNQKQTGFHKRLYLRNANVQWGKLVLGSLVMMDFSPADRAEFRLQAGDVLVCEGGEPGRAAIWRDEIPECYFQKALHRFRPNPCLLNAEYLIKVLLFMSERGGFKDHVTSATIAHLTGEKFKSLPIPMPPITLQKNFADIGAKARQLSQRSEQARLVDLKVKSVLTFCGFRGEL